jgi:hypothetical protein
MRAVHDLFAVRREAHERARGALKRQPPGTAPVGGHHEHLRRPLFLADEREQAPIRRKTWPRRLRDTGGQTLGATAGGAHRPQVVLADEHDAIAVQTRMTIVPARKIRHDDPFPVPSPREPAGIIAGFPDSGNQIAVS